MTVHDPFGGEATEICNQATVSSSGLNPVMTDDPDVSEADPDPTCTAIFMDTDSPTFTYVLADVEANQGEDTSPVNTGGEATATDNVTAEPTIGHTDQSAPGPEPYQTTITRTWTATDEANNGANTVQKITVYDTASYALSLDNSIDGLFLPASAAGHRQLGSIDFDGTIQMLGSDTSLDSGAIDTGAGITAYNMAELPNRPMDFTKALYFCKFDFQSILKIAVNAQLPIIMALINPNGRFSRFKIGCGR